MKNNIKRLNMKGIRLTSESDWIEVIISSEEIEDGIRLGSLQEKESKKLGLKDRSFSGDEKDSLTRSIAAKQFEIALRKWGGGTAKVIDINQFHNAPDVGQVNARFTFDPGYGLMITERDQGLVPMILGTGKCPNFKLMGWCIPDYIAQAIYKIHSGRCEDCSTEYGFLQDMKPHERCQCNMQMLMPMWSFNINLLK